MPEFYNKKILKNKLIPVKSIAKKTIPDFRLISMGLQQQIDDQVKTLNRLRTQHQLLVTGENGNDFNIQSSFDTHIFNIPDASNVNRGLITPQTQTIGGNKTFLNDLIVDGFAYLNEIKQTIIGSGTNTVDANLFKTRQFDITSTKGDIWVDDGTQLRRLPIGTTDQKLVVDPTTSTGLKWQDGGLFNGTIVLANPVTPPEITTNVNNYNPTGLSGTNMLRLSSNGNYIITGLQAPSPAVGQFILIINVGVNNLILKNDDVNSQAGNRFLAGADKLLQASETLVVVYDPISLRWRIVAQQL